MDPLSKGFLKAVKIHYFFLVNIPLINNTFNEDFSHLVARHCVCFLLYFNCVGLFFPLFLNAGLSGRTRPHLIRQAANNVH